MKIEPNKPGESKLIIKTPHKLLFTVETGGWNLCHDIDWSISLSFKIANNWVEKLKNELLIEQ